MTLKLARAVGPDPYINLLLMVANKLGNPFIYAPLPPSLEVMGPTKLSS